jgi:thiol:disulfide interchange protein
VVLLGVVRTAMGLPLFALGIWVTWRLVRQPIAPPAVDPV